MSETPAERLRRDVWNRGVRYQIQPNDLPGPPSFAHKGAKVAVFTGDRAGTDPQERLETLSQYADQGWRIFRVWHHEITDDDTRREAAKQIADTIKERKP